MAHVQQFAQMMTQAHQGGLAFNQVAPLIVEALRQESLQDGMVNLWQCHQPWRDITHLRQRRACVEQICLQGILRRPFIKPLGQLLDAYTVQQ